MSRQCSVCAISTILDRMYDPNKDYLSCRRCGVGELLMAWPVLPNRPLFPAPNRDLPCSYLLRLAASAPRVTLAQIPRVLLLAYACVCFGSSPLKCTLFLFCLCLPPSLSPSLRARVCVLVTTQKKVDPETDILIQSTMREEFRDCTVLCIAHRLHTIIYYDRCIICLLSWRPVFELRSHV